MTIDRDFYVLNKREVVKTLQHQHERNPHGFALAFLGDNENDDCIIRSMNISLLYNALDTVFMQSGRAFIHLRYATTSTINVTTTHGFINNNGQIIMHNGVISNPNRELVDSYRLSEFDDGEQAFEALVTEGENYANCFFIDTIHREYITFRLERNTLFTDGEGNYCTVQCGDINQPVDQNSIQIHGGYEQEDFDWDYLPAKYRTAFAK
jgi:predicted glutamine amidotransferase